MEPEREIARLPIKIEMIIDKTNGQFKELFAWPKAAIPTEMLEADPCLKRYSYYRCDTSPPPGVRTVYHSLPDIQDGGEYDLVLTNYGFVFRHPHKVPTPTQLLYITYHGDQRTGYFDTLKKATEYPGPRGLEMTEKTIFVYTQTNPDQINKIPDPTIKDALKNAYAYLTLYGTHHRTCTANLPDEYIDDTKCDCGYSKLLHQCKTALDKIQINPNCNP